MTMVRMTKEGASTHPPPPSPPNCPGFCANVETNLGV